MKRKLLVVDDDAQIADALAEYASGQNDYEVVCAYSGAEAAEVAVREKPDVILLDIALPGLDGRDVMVKLNATGVTDHAIVIFVTGRDLQSDRVLGLELGAVDYEVKPIHFGRLFRKIDRLLAKRAANEI